MDSEPITEDEVLEALSRHPSYSDSLAFDRVKNLAKLLPKYANSRLDEPASIRGLFEGQLYLLEAILGSPTGEHFTIPGIGRRAYERLALGRQKLLAQLDDLPYMELLPDLAARHSRILEVYKFLTDRLAGQSLAGCVRHFPHMFLPDLEDPLEALFGKSS